MNGLERPLRPHVARVRILHARLARDRESRRNGKPDVGHLGKVCALASELRLHGGISLGHVVPLGVLAESIDALHFFGHLYSP